MRIPTILLSSGYVVLQHALKRLFPGFKLCLSPQKDLAAAQGFALASQRWVSHERVAIAKHLLMRRYHLMKNIETFGVL